MKVDMEILLSLYLNDNEAMSEEQLHCLQEWMDASSDNRRQFVYASYLHRSLHGYLTGSDLQKRFVVPVERQASDDFPKDGYCEAAFWEALAQDEKQAETLVIPSLPEPEELITDVRRRKALLAPGRTRIPISTWISLGSLAAVLMLLVYITHFSRVPAQPVAALLDAVDARWESPIEVGARLYDSDTVYTLLEGYAKLRVDNGVVLYIDAPARFSFGSCDKMNLNHGRLTACVPATAIGFTVDTLNSRIIDLGTEFGVNVSDFGETQVHLFRGKASLVSSLDGQTLESLTLTQEQAKSVGRSGRITTIQLAQNTFIREIDSRSGVVWRGESLSLADIVGGGSGFGSGTRDSGIDPDSGQRRSRLDAVTMTTRPATRRFVETKEFPYIDCIFVPGFDEQPTPIASTGLTCDQFPPTSATLWGYLFNGAWHEGIGVPRHTLMLDNIVLDRSEGRQSLAIHPNMGITFDLRQIRRSLPRLQPVRLRTRAGLSQTAAQFTDSNPKSEFWILVDGQIRLRQRVQMSDGGYEMDIPLSSNDRFISLAVSDGDGDTAFNWAVFVNPVIELETDQITIE
jgi:hypothetical protein